MNIIQLDNAGTNKDNIDRIAVGGWRQQRMSTNSLQEVGGIRKELQRQLPAASLALQPQLQVRLPPLRGHRGHRNAM